jgi:glycolate oxidase iron-sulfur subunit
MERHSPRGRIALLRAVADGQLEMTPTLAREMYYCLSGRGELCRDV